MKTPRNENKIVRFTDGKRLKFLLTIFDAEHFIAVLGNVCIGGQTDSIRLLVVHQINTEVIEASTMDEVCRFSINAAVYSKCRKNGEILYI